MPAKKIVTIPHTVFRYTPEEAGKVVKDLLAEAGDNETLFYQKLKDRLDDPKEIVLFAYTVLPNIFYRPFTEFHYKFFDFLEIGVKNRKFKASKLPRGFGKSTIGTLLESVYDVCTNKVTFILINSYDGAMGKNKVKTIKEVFEVNEIIPKIYGKPQKSKDDTWTDSSLQIFGDRYIRCVSTNQTARGFTAGANFTRPQLIISDDILSEKDIENEKLRKDAENWYNSALRNCLGGRDGKADGAMVFSNTPLHPKDLIQTIFEGVQTKDKHKFSHQQWDTLHIPALVKQPPNNHRKSIDENWLNTSELLRMEQEDPIGFVREYLGQPISMTSGEFITEGMLPCWQVFPDTIKDLVIHADLIHKESNDSDDFCWVVCGIDPVTARIYVYDFYLAKIGQIEQAKALIELYQRLMREGFRIKKFTFDEKANWGFDKIVDEVSINYYNGVPIPIEPLKWTAPPGINPPAVALKKSVAKVKHLWYHRAYFMNKRIYLPQYHRDIVKLKNQLIGFPQSGLKDDGVDGLLGCLDAFAKGGMVGFRKKISFKEIT